MPYVGPEGPKNAQIAIVAEKPARDEVRAGRPLVGATGREVNEHLRKAGIPREAVYLTNAVKQVENFDNPTDQQIKEALPKLVRELRGLPYLNCIIPMGNVALLALSNFQYNSILSYRGSIVKSILGTKMVPTVHPSFYFRGEWRYKPIVTFDIKRALEESHTPEIVLPKRTYYIKPTIHDVREWTKYIIAKSKYISFDIETKRSNRGPVIDCIAFSIRPDEAFCFPIFNYKDRSDYWSLGEEREVWQLIQQILKLKHAIYVTQNGQMFDCYHLWRHGIETPFMSNGLDTMLMHRLRAPDLPHDLAFLVSIYTREPYYKDESGYAEDEYIPTTNEQHWIYNCKDAACTLEVAQKLEEELNRFGQLDFFKSEIQSLWNIATETRIKGIRVDKDRLRELRMIYDDKINRAKKSLELKLGWVPNTRASLDMEKLFTDLKISYRKTPTGKAQLKRETLYEYAGKYESARPLLTEIIELNKQRHVRSQYLGLHLDRNDYYHPALDISKAKSGRFASAGEKSPEGEKGNPQIQNIPMSLRCLFIPDSAEDEFTQCDLKQAEARIQIYYANDEVLIEALEKGLDIYRILGCSLYRSWPFDEMPPQELIDSINKVCPKCAEEGESSCNHSERYMSKQSKLAFGYRMGPKKFLTTQRDKGIYVELREAQRIRGAIITRPYILWHNYVLNCLKRSPWIQTILNRKREVYGILDDFLLNDVLSWLCQTVVGEITNHAMLLLDNTFKEKQIPARIVTQTHDSLLVCHRREIRGRIINLMQKAFDRELEINGRKFRIPLEISHGENWGEMS